MSKARREVVNFIRKKTPIHPYTVNKICDSFCLLWTPSTPTLWIIFATLSVCKELGPNYCKTGKTKLAEDFLGASLQKKCCPKLFYFIKGLIRPGQRAQKLSTFCLNILAIYLGLELNLCYKDKKRHQHWYTATLAFHQSPTCPFWRKQIKRQTYLAMMSQKIFILFILQVLR